MSCPKISYKTHILHIVVNHYNQNFVKLITYDLNVGPLQSTPAMFATAVWLSRWPTKEREKYYQRCLFRYGILTFLK